MQCSFSDDPALSDALFDLLDEVFPGLRRAARGLRKLGSSWESISTPFVHFAEGRPIAHIGVIEMPLVLMGRPVTVGSIHAVATHPRFRRRGFYHKLMQEVLEASASRHQTLILTTDHPAYYEPFGFRTLQEHLFRLRQRPRPGRDGLRLMNMQTAADVDLLNGLLEARVAVSRVVGVTNARAVFHFNEAHRPLYHVEGLDVVLCLEVEGRTLKLFDIVGPALPSLEELLARMPWPIAEVAVNFAVDRLVTGQSGTEVAIMPRVLDHDGPSYLMARGPFEAEREAFTLPRSART